MTRFLGGLNEEISGFVEMFPYHTFQDLVEQAMRTERKIQQETRGKSYASHSIAAHGASSSPALRSVGDGLMVLQLGPLHLMLLQRWLFLQHHLLKISSVLLQVQQPQLLLPQLLLPLHIVEKLCATSAMVVDILLHNVPVGGP